MSDEKILYKELCYKMVGCFYEVFNTLGPGFKEIIYHKALLKEFKEKKIPYSEKPKIAVSYKDIKAGTYEPDFVIDDKVILELKAVEIMPRAYEKQLYSYLKATPYKVGYIINFGNRLDIRRRVFDSARH